MIDDNYISTNLLHNGMVWITLRWRMQESNLHEGRDPIVLPLDEFPIMRGKHQTPPTLSFGFFLFA